MKEGVEGSKLDTDIVISSRIRMARNIADIPFPHHLSETSAKEVTTKVYNSIISGNSCLREEFILKAMKDLDEIERLNYIEKHLISPDLAKNIISGNMLINKEETISILINEEDHIRIQCLLPDLQLDKALDTANKIDDLLEENIDYAFDEKLGYLTACPTNVGTGIRASVMLHLPALKLTSHINAILRAAGQIGLAVRGIYGEGTEFTGNIYQISNQVTLGVREDEIIGNLYEVTRQIIKKENAARERIFTNQKIDLEDKLFRSYGILKNARKITANEAMQLISDVKLGANMGIIKEVNIEKLNCLTPMLQAGFLQKHYKTKLSANERDIRRAELIRDTL